MAAYVATAFGKTDPSLICPWSRQVRAQLNDPQLEHTLTQ
jgi:hypothetical protein